MRISILLLGPARQFAGAEAVEIDIPKGASIADLRRALAARIPEIRTSLPAMRFALNREFVSDDTLVHPDDEVALIPPVSGGNQSDSILAAMVTEPIDADAVRSFVTGDAAQGGIVTFEGATRAEQDASHGRLVMLDYEAYDKMAQQQLERLAGDARTRWKAGRVALIHRVGPVMPGEVSVMIAVACPHRAEAFEACRWLIDTLKKDVPIWKKDVFEDGFVRWVEPGDAAGSRKQDQDSRQPLDGNNAQFYSM
jgi:MoaE-MoaD fusion protein